MKLELAKEICEALTHCLAHKNHHKLNDAELAKIESDTQNRKGEFTSRWEPSTVRQFLKLHTQLKSQIEEAEIQGKNSV